MEFQILIKKTRLWQTDCRYHQHPVKPSHQVQHRKKRTGSTTNSTLIFTALHASLSNCQQIPNKNVIVAVDHTTTTHGEEHPRKFVIKSMQKMDEILRASLHCCNQVAASKNAVQASNLPP